jgi:sucrose-6-phosphate hydrolase SacC (GH32 family)
VDSGETSSLHPPPFKPSEPRGWCNRGYAATPRCIACAVSFVAVAADPDDPDLRKWNKTQENPVISLPPSGVTVTGWRRIWWAWLHEMRSLRAQQEAGWAGVMSLPKILTVQANGRLRIAPAPELKTLRRRSHKLRNLSIKPDGPLLLKQISGDCVEIVAEIDLGNAHKVGLRVRSAAEMAANRH